MIKKIKVDGAEMEFNIVKSGVQLCFTPTEFGKPLWSVILVEKDDEGVYHITRLDECNDLASANKSFESFRAKHWFEKTRRRIVRSLRHPRQRRPTAAAILTMDCLNSEWVPSKE